MVRAAMRAALFLAGKRPGAPVRRSALSAAVAASGRAAARKRTPVGLVIKLVRGRIGCLRGGRGHGLGLLPLPSPDRRPLPHRPLLPQAQAQFARTLALELAPIALSPADGDGGGGGGARRASAAAAASSDERMSAITSSMSRIATRRPRTRCRRSSALRRR